MTDHPPEPTAAQCSAAADLPPFNGQPCMACWYPQMGGYVGRCVVCGPHPGEDISCVDVYVWHDGEFPFRGDDPIGWEGDKRKPAYVHHCDVEQFINFGRLVMDRMFQEVKS